MKLISFILFIFFSLNTFSCHKPKWKKAENGIQYKIYSNDASKPKPLIGDHIWMHLRKYSPDEKEMFNTTIFETNKGVELDLKQPENSSDVISFFTKLGKGDSALIKIPAHLIDSSDSSNKYYLYKLHLINFKTKQVYQQEITEENIKQQSLDSIYITQYLQKHTTNHFMQDEYGNWYNRTNYGNGKRIKENDSIQIHYIGKLIDGFEFDNSYERDKALDFIVGQKQVIEGLDKGIQDFFVGDKGILIIPSRLAYGNKSVGKIPTNAVLVFEIEIIDN